VDRDYHVGVLVKRLRRIEKGMSGEARTLFGRWIEGGDIGRFAGDLAKEIKRDFNGTMKLLRDLEFQKALENYPRAKATFWIGHEVVDTVSSQRVDRFGKFDNAEDYLCAFSDFVHANADKIDALRVLVNRPRGWNPKVLEELKRVLAQNDFDAPKLQKAHARAGHKQLADIISIVKHAATAQAALLNAEERVTRAINKLVESQKFTAEQMQWLSLIQEHLIKNLTIDEDDFDLPGLLSDRGGKSRARKVFGDLPGVVAELNEAVAA
jgi:type I restriction enzyme, R subunit